MDVNGEDTMLKTTVVVKDGIIIELQHHGDGYEAWVQDRHFQNSHPVKLPVYYAEGYTSCMFEKEAKVWQQRHIEVINVRTGVKVVYIGPCGLVGGGQSQSSQTSSTSHTCNHYGSYRCSECNFKCPNNACYNCCVHKDHPCSRKETDQVAEREVLAKLERQIAAKLERERERKRENERKEREEYARRRAEAILRQREEQEHQARVERENREREKREREHLKRLEQEYKEKAERERKEREELARKRAEAERRQREEQEYQARIERERKQREEHARKRAEAERKQREEQEYQARIERERKEREEREKEEQQSLLNSLLEGLDNVEIPKEDMDFLIDNEEIVTEQTQFQQCIILRDTEPEDEGMEKIMDTEDMTPSEECVEDFAFLSIAEEEINIEVSVDNGNILSQDVADRISNMPEDSFLAQFFKDNLSEFKLDENVENVFKTKLSEADLETQRALVTYFMMGGKLYNNVIMTDPVKLWLEKLLLQEITSHTVDPIALERFNNGWLNITETFSSSHQTQLLQVLWQKQISCNFSLLDINDIIDLVLESSSFGYNAVCSNQEAWLQELIHFWLAQRLASFHFTEQHREQLALSLSLTNWRKDATEIFLSKLSEQSDVEYLLEFISLINKKHLSEKTMLKIIETHVHPDYNGNNTKSWVHTLKYQLLNHAISPHNEDVAKAIVKPLYQFIQTDCSIEPIEEFLIHNLDCIAEHTSEFVAVLNLLNNYNIKQNLYLRTFELLSTITPPNWITAVDELIVSELFGDSHKYEIEELYELIQSSSPSINVEELKNSFETVEKIYSSRSMVAECESDRSIKHWNENDVTKWVESVKKITLSCEVEELVAVVKQAAYLHNRFHPRSTQILALLTLLYPAKDEGRLVQINTGEGKSLIVAMFAAIKALQGMKVDVVTTSTELSIREANNQKPFFEMLGLSVGENSDIENKKNAYKSDIVYGTTSDFQGDILRKEFYGEDWRQERSFDCVVVDEVDSMLYDNRTNSVRLAEQNPGMNYLELPLVAVWERVYSIASHLIEIDGEVYFIPENFKRTDTTIELDSGKPWEDVAMAVVNKKEFIIENTEEYLVSLFGDFSAKEVEKEQLPDNVDDLSLIKHPFKETIPSHVLHFAKLQIPYWIKNAMKAIFSFKREAHYTVKDNCIIPIHYNQTGVLQENLVWSNGLTQFLQLKEGLPLVPESVATNFISNVSYFVRYGSSLFGLTGTIGEKATQEFLYEIYGADIVVIPPFKHRKVIDNEHSSYLCKELAPIKVSNKHQWYENIISQVLYHAEHQRAVLLICKYIYQVNHLHERLTEKYDSAKLFLYTGKEKFKKNSINSGEIIIATNIAGRGTDLKTSETVEHHGGMYVAITFLPDSYRVELQNVGRTAREGKKGMAQLILHAAHDITVKTLKEERHDQEVEATQNAIVDAKKMQIQDYLFFHFCSLESELLPSVSDLDKESLWKQLIKQWAIYEREHLSPTNLRLKLQKWKNYLKNKYVSSTLGKMMEGVRKLLHSVTLRKYKNRLEERIQSDLSNFESEYRIKVRKHFCATHSKVVPSDVLLCLAENREFIPKRSSLAEKYNWGKFERKALEERWAFWLNGKHFEEGEVSLQSAVDLFKQEFSTHIQHCAAENKLVQNPFFYVLKGNEYLKSQNIDEAIDCYNKAIEMDPIFSVQAHYNKARALLSNENNKGNPQEDAYDELMKAKSAISKTLQPNLVAINMFITNTGSKVRTVQHIQHQMDVLCQQENYIKEACKILKGAGQNNRNVKLTAIPLQQTFREDHSKVILEDAVNGLTELFTIEEVVPFPWLTTIALSLLAVGQIIAGCFVFACTGNPLGLVLIGTGVADAIAAVKTILTRKFSWGSWCIGRACIIVSSILSGGWKCVKAVKNTFQKSESINKDSLGINLAYEVALDVLNDCLNFSEQYYDNKKKIDIVQNAIKNIIQEKLSAALQNNPLVISALQQDINKGREYWLQMIANDALSAIKNQENVNTSQMTEIVKNATEAGLDEEGNNIISNYIDKFIDSLNTKVSSHKANIESDVKSNISKTETGTISSVTQMADSPDVVLDETNIKTDVSEQGTSYSSKPTTKGLPLHTNYISLGPPTPESIIEVCKEQIVKKLMNGVEDSMFPEETLDPEELINESFKRVEEIKKRKGNKK